VNKLWGIVFAVVLAACGLSFVISPWMGWGLPEGVSTHAAAIDDLWYVILYITGFFFFLTEAILVAFLFLYSGEPGSRPPRATGVPPALKSLESVLHDQHRIEMLWTIVPAIILLYIAFAQIGTWSEVKYQKYMPEFGKKTEDGKTLVPLPVAMSARQFEWRVRYPSHERFKQWLKADPADKADFNSFGKNPQADDIDLVNEVHTWVGAPTVVFLTTRDVIHSFNIPIMRVKQDALPGKVIPVWFVPTQANTAKVGDTFVDGKRFEGKADDKTRIFAYTKNASGEYSHKPEPANVWDIPCAELCGWGHYRMIGRVYVHPSQEQFLEWLEMADKEAHKRSGPR
jgi:cytochrome c oxidase subunit 2